MTKPEDLEAKGIDVATYYIEQLHPEKGDQTLGEAASAIRWGGYEQCSTEVLKRAVDRFKETQVGVEEKYRWSAKRFFQSRLAIQVYLLDGYKAPKVRKSKKDWGQNNPYRDADEGRPVDEDVKQQAIKDYMERNKKR